MGIFKSKEEKIREKQKIVKSSKDFLLLKNYSFFYKTYKKRHLMILM